jgi:cell division protein FtsB
MKRNTKVGLLVVAFCALAGILFWIGTNSSAKAQDDQQQVQHVQPENVLARINSRAHAAKDGEERAVRDLADDVVESFTPSEVPAFTKEMMKDRLARAELSYRQGKQKGISEHDVAKTVNQLADELGAPEYGKTNSGQVRILRVSMMSGMPNLISPGAPKIKDGRASLSDMSPVEAVSVALLMVHQKMHNEAYQVTHREFVANLRQKHREQWEAHRAGKSNNGQGHTAEGPRLITGTSPDSKTKRKEMSGAITRGTKAMKAEKLTGLADKTLDTLGIEP